MHRSSLQQSLRILLLAVMAFLQLGCGFHLRGMLARPTWFRTVAINMQEAHPEFAFALKESFKTMGVLVLPDPRRADCVLVIEKEASSKNLTSVSASTTPRQYQMTYMVYYSLLKASGESIISSNAISVSRQLTVNNNRILGSDFEEMLNYKEMRKELAVKILNRMNRLLPSSEAVIANAAKQSSGLGGAP